MEDMNIIFICLLITELFNAIAFRDIYIEIKKIKANNNIKR